MQFNGTLFLCMALSLIACGNDSGSDDSCEHGSTFGAADGCNTCTCPESGKMSEAACTEIGCPPYDSCKDKKCGDTCSVCDPADKECVETAVDKVCNKAMECTADTRESDCEEEAQALWYTSCGDPVCSGHTEQEGMALCDTETPGDQCSDEGRQCDPVNLCNAVLVCATADPKTQPAGCPKSRKETKTDIRYLDVDELKKIHKELMAIRLAKWRYKNEVPTPKARLGFIIEDIEPSVAANSERDRVDLYSFASMAVASVQHQDKELTALKKEVAALKKMLKDLKSKK